MNRPSRLALLSLFIPSLALAQPAQPPRLVVLLTVDQLSTSLWNEYRGQWSGGFARLAGGTVYANGYQGHAATETCPGHAAIATGTRPSRNGVIANHWVDFAAPRADKTIYCAEDERIPGTSSDNYRVSAIHLSAPTLGDWMKRRWPASRNVAVAGKDRVAAMLGGSSPDQRFYWGGKDFTTDRPAPAPVAGLANAALARQLAAPQPALEATPICAAKATTYALPGGLTVGNGTFARAAGDIASFRRSPEFDGAVLALSAALVRDLRLGQGQSPDLLSIGLSATDYVGHAYGSGGQEMCLNLLSLDRDLGDFFFYLDSTGVDYAVALSSDHGVLDIPERLKAKGAADAAWADPALATAAVGAVIAAQLGLEGPVLAGDNGGDIYVDPRVPASARKRVLDAAASFYSSHPQVETVLTRAQVEAAPAPSGDPSRWTFAQRFRASFDPRRSGDLFVVLKANVMPIATPKVGSVATHGSPWDHDRRVPVIFWRKGSPASAPGEVVETVDIAPTLAAMLGLTVNPASVDGRCLNGTPGVACPTR